MHWHFLHANRMNEKTSICYNLISFSYATRQNKTSTYDISLGRLFDSFGEVCTNDTHTHTEWEIEWVCLTHYQPQQWCIFSILNQMQTMWRNNKFPFRLLPDQLKKGKVWLSGMEWTLVHWCGASSSLIYDLRYDISILLPDKLHTPQNS